MSFDLTRLIGALEVAAGRGPTWRAGRMRTLAADLAAAANVLEEEDDGREPADAADELAAALAERDRWLAWSGGRYPDDTPGEVVAAEADGTIVVDGEAIVANTWDPLRALAFLSAKLAHAQREPREYRLRRTFDIERDGMGGSDTVPLGVVPQRRALELAEMHRRHAMEVVVEWRTVGEWRVWSPRPGVYVNEAVGPFPRPEPRCSCGRLLRGYAGPLCRYCDGTAV